MYVDVIIKTIDYIESHLKHKINMEHIARHVNYSPYHLIRLFDIVVGDTPGNYLRKRRLTESALELKENKVKIIEIAMEYQFESSEAFSRAFKKYFNISPITCRKSNQHIPLFYRCKITPEKINTYRRIFMEPKFETLKPMYLVGIMYYGQNENEEIPRMWERHFSKFASLNNRIDRNTTYGFCFHHEDYNDYGLFNYIISQEVESLDHMPIEMVGKHLPGREYAVFTVTDDDLSGTYQYIYGEYLPKQSFKEDASFNFEKYTTLKDGTTEVKIYIPIIK